MSVFEDKQKMGLIPFELKNVRNVRIQCVPFVAIITGLTQEEKYAVYEDNYYRLQEYISLEKELGIDLVTLVRALKEGIYVHLQEPYGIVHDTVRLKFDGSYVYLVLDTVNSQVCCNNYGQSWSLTREELEK